MNCEKLHENYPKRSCLIDFEGYFEEIAIYDNYCFYNFFVTSHKKLRFYTANYNWIVKHHHKIPYTYGHNQFLHMKKLLQKYNVIICKDKIKKQI